MKNKQKQMNGITLIVLVITIIVLLILAGVSIATLTEENGILTKATEASIETRGASVEEARDLWKVNQETDKNTENTTAQTLEELLNDLESQKLITAQERTLVEETGQVTIGSKTITFGEVSIEYIFDNTGEIEGKLHIGDFINYTAGNWTETEITAIGANNSTSLPSNSYQFGGYIVGSSRDGNATPFSTAYSYVTDSSTGKAITGWRLFDVADDGTVTLISAGCPEDYYHRYGTNYGYISEYILTGNVNSNANADTLGLGITYKARDWSMYVNSKYKAISATTLTKEKLDAWFNKYMNIASANTYNYITYHSMDTTKYESMVDNYSWYWLTSAANSNTLGYVDPYKREVSNGGFEVYANGLRILVSLSSEVKVSGMSSETKTIIDPRNSENSWTYNVWDIK